VKGPGGIVPPRLGLLQKFDKVFRVPPPGRGLKAEGDFLLGPPGPGGEPGYTDECQGHPPKAGPPPGRTFIHQPPLMWFARRSLLHDSLGSVGKECLFSSLPLWEGARGRGYPAALHPHPGPLPPRERENLVPYFLPLPNAWLSA